MSHPSLLTLACQHCAAPLEIGPTVERFACAFCGTSQIVHREGGIVRLEMSVHDLRKIQNDTSRTAAELTLLRLRDELKSKIRERDAALSIVANPLSFESHYLAFSARIAVVVAGGCFCVFIFELFDGIVRGSADYGIWQSIKYLGYAIAAFAYFFFCSHLAPYEQMMIKGRNAERIEERKNLAERVKTLEIEIEEIEARVELNRKVANG